MNCPVCGGRLGSYAGHDVPSQSRLIKQLVADLGPTCFCRASISQVEALIVLSEENLGDLVKEHFPGAKNREEINKKLRALPQNDMLRQVFFKRMEYEDLLRVALDKKSRAAPPREEVSMSKRFDTFGF